MKQNLNKLCQIQRYTEITHDPFSLVLLKEYFDCPHSTERLSRSTLHLRGGSGESVLFYSVVFQL
jgi:hypothetical protein